MSMRVAIIGAGGLGGPVAYALSAAGAALVLCDDDVVDLSNLQRQVQFRTADIGRPKTVALSEELARRGHDRSRLRLVAGRFGAGTADAILGGVDVVIDGSDNFATKFAVNDACVARGLPFVIGSVLRYGGQVFAMAPGAHDRGCYRCLFEDEPGDAEGASCAEAGVLGAAVAVIGGLAARAALALGRGDEPLGGPPGGALWVIDDVRAALGPRWARMVRFAPRPGCPACAGVVSGALDRLQPSFLPPVRVSEEVRRGCLQPVKE